MSYDLAVWEGRRPASNVEAEAVYEQLIERLERDIEPPSSAIKAYVEALLSRWPDIDQDDGVDSPWADSPLIGNATGEFIYFAMVFSQADEASEYAARLAAEQGLVCFDPQEGRLRPFREADGPAYEYKHDESVVCSICGRPFGPNEPRASEARIEGEAHLECLMNALAQ